jgi:ankyrin repeat protein
MSTDPHGTAQPQSSGSDEVSRLKSAIDNNDLAAVQALLSRNPELHRAPLGYCQNGPLTWVAECRVPREPPGVARLEMARWMIVNGSDVHQGGDGPLMRAALVDHRLPMMELLVAHGADVNAVWGGYYPIIFAPCETLAPAALQWLLEHGANPNCAEASSKYPGTALDQAIRTYARSPRLGACIDVLVAAGGVTVYDLPPVLALLRGDQGRLAGFLEVEPNMVHRRWPQLDFGATAMRRLTLGGATLLHVAAEYGNAEAARLLLDRGADVNARAAVDDAGPRGQTPLFHAASQFNDWGLAVTRLLLDHGADAAVRVRLPGHHEKPDEVVECTPLGYVMLFPGETSAKDTIGLLRARGAVV